MTNATPDRLVYHESAADQLANRCQPGSVDLFVVDWPYINIVRKDWDKTFTVQDALGVARAALDVAAPTASMVTFHGVGKHGDHNLFDIIRGMEELGWKYRNWITWAKRRGYGTQKNYLFTREEIVWFSMSDDFTFHPGHTEQLRGYKGWNKDYPAKSDYKRVTNVWTDIGEIMRPIHPCEKPEALMRRIVSTHSNPSDLVVDPFVGCGPTGAACGALGRRFMGCDLDPKWAEHANDRALRAAAEAQSAAPLPAPPRVLTLGR